MKPQLTGKAGISEEERLRKGWRRKQGIRKSIRIRRGGGNGWELRRKQDDTNHLGNQIEEAARRDGEGSPWSNLDLDEHQTGGIHQIRHICQQVDTCQDGHRQPSVPATHCIGLYITTRAAWIH